jgi:hypothetical protein
MGLDRSGQFQADFGKVREKVGNRNLLVVEDSDVQGQDLVAAEDWKGLRPWLPPVQCSHLS